MYYTRAEISWRGIFKWINIADKTYYPGITRACRVWSVSKYIKSFLSQGNYRKRNFSRYESVNNIYFDRLLRVESYLFRDRDNSFATFNFRQRYLVSRYPLLSNNPTKFVFHHSPSLREEDSEIPQLGIRRDPSIDSKKKLDVKSSPTTSAKNNFHRSTTRSSSFGIDPSRKLERRSSDFRGQRGGGWNLTAEVKVAR